MFTRFTTAQVIDTAHHGPLTMIRMVDHQNGHNQGRRTRNTRDVRFPLLDVRQSRLAEISVIAIRVDRRERAVERRAAGWFA